MLFLAIPAIPEDEPVQPALAPDSARPKGTAGANARGSMTINSVISRMPSRALGLKTFDPGHEAPHESAESFYLGTGRS
jgi:hypothetical protein